MSECNHDHPTRPCPYCEIKMLNAECVRWGHMVLKTENERDLWKAKAERYEKALTQILINSNAYGNGNEHYGINKIYEWAKSALAPEGK